MAWQGIEGHDQIVADFRRCLSRGRLAHSYLFVGPPGVGKFTFALRLAQSLLCQRNEAQHLDPCGQCDTCVQAMARTHPDIEVISRPENKSTIPIELLIGDDRHRRRQGLCYWVAKKPIMGGWKIAVVDDADFLSEEGGNCLLKTLEEPPPQSILFLIGTSLDRQLPTIRSRCQIIRFGRLSETTLSGLLIKHDIAASSEEAERLVAFGCEGLTRAAQLADPDLWEFRAQFVQTLAAPGTSSVALTRQVTTFIDSAGKEGAARRLRAAQIVEMAIDFYRAGMSARLQLSGEKASSPGMASSATDATGRVGADSAAESIDRCLEALDHIQRNAHLATTAACWIDDLYQLQSG